MILDPDREKDGYHTCAKSRFLSDRIHVPVVFILLKSSRGCPLLLVIDSELLTYYLKITESVNFWKLHDQDIYIQ